MSPKLDPATDFNGAQAEVIALLHSDQVDPFTLSRVRRRVEALANSDPCGRFELLSAIAARTGDVEESATLFQKALLAEPGERVATIKRHISFMQSTIQLGRVREVFETHYQAIRNHPDAVRRVHDTLFMCGYFRTAERLVADGERLGAPIPGRDPDAVPILDLAGVDENDIAAVVAHCVEFLRSELSYPELSRAQFLGPAMGDPGVLIEFATAGDPEALAEIEWRLIESLAEREFPVVDSGFLSVSLLPHTEAEATACQ